MNKVKMAYAGKKVYVGMDEHKRTYSGTAICEGEIVKRDTMLADSKGLIRYLKQHVEGAVIDSVYEEGYC